MNLRNLRYFCAAYEAGTTVAAARQCHVTQPVISNAIAQLEEELGTRLFTRQQRGLLPTAASCWPMPRRWSKPSRMRPAIRD
jgi:DNA-binding transcriptional LysR family regulator